MKNPTTVSGTITDCGWSTFTSSYPLDLSNVTFDSETKISQKQNQYKSDAEEEFKTGYSLGEDKEIIKAAQNFIRIMLAPLYKNIEFETDAQIIPRNSLPLLSYLQNESMNYKEELFKTKEGTELLAKYNLLNGDN